MAEHVWMTYQQLADRLGVGVDGARMKAKRAGWMKGPPDNEGRAMVSVPMDALPLAGANGRSGRFPAERSGLVRGQAERHETGEQAEHEAERGALAAALAQVQELRTALDAEQRHREADRAARERLAAALSGLLERVGQDEAARREEVARALDDRDRAREDADEARAELRDARAALDAAQAEIGRMFDDVKGLADQVAEGHGIRMEMARQLDRMRRDREAEMDEHARLRAEVERLRQPWWRRWRWE